MRRNSSDAPSKLRFCSRPYFGFVVGSLPGRVFQNSFNIFSRPRHALKPPLICLLIRLRDHACYGRWSKSFTFNSVVASWRPSWPNFQKLFFFIFLTLRHALKPWLICLLIQRQLCVLQQKIKIAIFPKVPGLISRTVYTRKAYL